MKPGSWSSIASIFLFGVLGASTVSKLVPLGADIGSRDSALRALRTSAG